MNEKFYVLTRNLFLSVAISVIIYGIYGSVYNNATYYWWTDYDSKIEITKALYDENSTINNREFVKIDHFNAENAIPAGLGSFGISFLLLTGIAIKKSRIIKAL